VSAALTPVVVLEVLDLLRARVPGLSWHPTRVSDAIADFPAVDHKVCAGEVADWIAYQSSGKVKDGIPVLRRFMERRQREGGAAPPPRERTDLSVYDTFLV
jgi:hypothetical protein